MKKFAIAFTVLLVALPLAACGGTSAEAESAPIPEISAPIPEISDPIPPVSEENNLRNPPEEAEAPTAKYILVRADGLNVRSGAGVSHAVLGQAERDVLLAYGGTEGGWHRTKYRGKTAYVSAAEPYTSLAELPAGSARTEAVIGEGLALLGTPYVYGAVRLHDGTGRLLSGFSAQKFDCSSLMQYIFYRGAGVLLDVTTRTQIKQGVRVERTDIARGDLLFFTNASRQYKTGLERVGHVALYLGGNYILHTASDYAKVEQISAARWNFFLEARRVM